MAIVMLNNQSRRVAAHPGLELLWHMMTIMASF
ncbi:hypothetical protein SVI_0877 [Shewanella violacea DSS12]|uniref:Uncharacterized protein n=1 Tax=Shewanella violacea (strain JCM 10179 / CIP 106290 / LMG 19151 / DSS12) TaxID=637905 RepID=D4ZGP9_SHEVD|nr:hypothetical protein SVI_0877 [Shewanella violacea DSS12]